MDERQRRWLAEPSQRRERLILVVCVGLALAALLVAALVWFQPV